MIEITYNKEHTVSYHWLDKSDYIKKLSVATRFLYYMGVLKIKPFKNRTNSIYNSDYTQLYNGQCYMRFGLRWWNPISYVVLLILYIFLLLKRMYGSVFDFIDITRELDNVEPSVFKVISKKEPSENYKTFKR